MANTPNLDLVKPAGTDHALVSVINSNSDKIDGGFGTLSEQITYTKITSATNFNTLTVGSNKQAKHYRGENIGNNTNIPSDFAGSNIPWGMDVIPIGDSYSKQILHLYGQSYREYERQQKYDNGNVVWQDWYSSYDRIANNYGQITTGITYQKQADVVTIFINGVTVSSASTWTLLNNLPNGMHTRYSAHVRSMDGTELQASGTTLKYRGSASDIYGIITYVCDPNL